MQRAIEFLEAARNGALMKAATLENEIAELALDEDKETNREQVAQARADAVEFAAAIDKLKA